MSKETKPQDCCEDATVSVRCEGDTLVIRLQGESVARMTERCCSQKSKDEDCC